MLHGVQKHLLSVRDRGKCRNNPGFKEVNYVEVSKGYNAMLLLGLTTLLLKMHRS